MITLNFSKRRICFGNPPVDYAQGKYASLAGPAFAMIYNAITGNPDAVKRERTGSTSCIRDSGLQQHRKEYTELYGYATGIL